jgi:hypothetical protein
MVPYDQPEAALVSDGIPSVQVHLLISCVGHDDEVDHGHSAHA